MKDWKKKANEVPETEENEIRFSELYGAEVEQVEEALAAYEPKYVQFSDHNIAPVKASHFHIYMGNTSQEELLKEMDHWPTYYPKSLTKDEIVREMMGH